MVADPDVDETQGLDQAPADELIGTADLNGEAGVVMYQQDRGRLALQDQLDDLPGMDAGPIDGAAEELHEPEQPMVPVQTDHAEVLAVPIAERNGEEVPDYLGARQRCAAAHTPLQVLLGPREDRLRLCRNELAALVEHVEGIGSHRLSPGSGRDCPRARATARGSAAVKAVRTARTRRAYGLDGENRAVHSRARASP